MTGVRAACKARVEAGVLATVVMDAAMLAAGRIGGEAFSSERLDPDVIGRWGTGLLRGRLRHADASSEAPSWTDLPAGIATHYATGIALTAAFLVLAPRRLRTSMAAATGYGVATAVLPLLVLFPSLGYGWLGLRSGEAARMARIMLLGHTAFGIGIGLGARRAVARRAG